MSCKLCFMALHQKFFIKLRKNDFLVFAAYKRTIIINIVIVVVVAVAVAIVCGTRRDFCIVELEIIGKLNRV